MLPEPSSVKSSAAHSSPHNPGVPIAQRIDLPASLIGFAPPPHRTGLRFLPVAEIWTVIALTAPGRPTEIAAWLQAYGPSTITIGPGLAPKVLRATFETLPPAWTGLVTSLTLQHVLLTPDGCASLFVQDSIDNVGRFMAVLGHSWPLVRSRPTNPDPARTQLTNRQEEALSLAVALGYYELPHKLNLRELGKRMQLSVGAVSELLRRAEAHLVTSHVDARTGAQWDGTDAPVQVPLPLLEPPKATAPATFLTKKSPTPS